MLTPASIFIKALAEKGMAAGSAPLTPIDISPRQRVYATLSMPHDAFMPDAISSRRLIDFTFSRHYLLMPPHAAQPCRRRCHTLSFSLPLPPDAAAALMLIRCCLMSPLYATLSSQRPPCRC